MSYDQHAADCVSELAACRTAWRLLQGAERTILRLRGYARLTAAMKTDLYAAERIAHESRATLQRILGAQA